MESDDGEDKKENDVCCVNDKIKGEYKKGNTETGNTRKHTNKGNARMKNRKENRGKNTKK